MKQVKESKHCIGIDLGVKDFVITSEGEYFENLHFKKSETNKIKRLQRQLSRKVKGSNNRNKARIRLAKEYKKITDRKQYYLHSVSNSLIDENQVICMEDLNVKGMLRNHKLAESIAEVNLGEFRRIMEYKCKWYGRQLLFVDRWYPSSKTCNHCGYIKKDLKLDDREWICPECGEMILRDENAAKNILDEALRFFEKSNNNCIFENKNKIGSSTTEFTLVENPPMDDRLINEGLRSSDSLKQENYNEHFVQV